MRPRQDDLLEAINDGIAHRETMEQAHLVAHLGREIVDYLIDRYQIAAPTITKAQAQKYAKAVKALCYQLGIEEYLNLPPCYIAQFLDDKINAGAKRSEIRALAQGISYAHRRVWFADPTTDPIVKTIINRKRKSEQCLLT
jgi:hypothetical protein